MRTKRHGKVTNPRLYQNFKTAQDIGDVINRSRGYVFKALKNGFTDRELKLLEERMANSNGRDGC